MSRIGRTGERIPVTARAASSLARVGLSALWVIAGTGAAFAQVEITLEPLRDNSLYQAPVGVPELLVSNGAGIFLFAGRGGIDAGFRVRRALLKFDLTALPEGARIVAAELSLYQSKAGPATVPEPVGLYRLRQDWGEGASDGIGPEGQGAPATEGDATWFHTFWPDANWNVAGGDYAVTPSASTTVGDAEGAYVWTCQEGLLADLRAWQADPENNFGWIVISAEGLGNTAHRFNSREHPEASQRPRLRIEYLPADSLSADGFEDLPCS